MVRLTLRDIFWSREILNEVACKDCVGQFAHWQAENHCQGCGRGGCTKGQELCDECRRWNQLYGWYLHHRGLYHYNLKMKEYMHRYKFAGDYRLRKVFQTEFSTHIQRVAADYVIPIPVTTVTWQTRGFNQVVGLLREVPYLPALKVKAREKVNQSSKTRQERLLTPQPFTLEMPERFKQKKILLVDDIYTTGRTLYHAADLFHQADCAWVKSISLAR
ncbi:ComF family protein [Limosilactobacillus rudii]|nr:phosphoribosyltransferase family protein [Limosilactobacillus rudii]MCD7135398.1 ComF family protein [Limosilactobacillus rudii]